MNPLKRFVAFIQTPGHTRTLTALVILIIAAAVPLTVLVAQQQQNIKQKAATTFVMCASTAGGGQCSSTACGTSYSSGNALCNTLTKGLQNYCCPIGATTQTPIASSLSSPTCLPIPCCYWAPGKLHCLPAISENSCPERTIPPLRCITTATPSPKPSGSVLPTPTPTPTPTPPITIVPNCNSGYFCNNTCTSSQTNTCSNNGTQTCYYKTSTTGQVCNSVSVYPSCSVNNCSNGYSCSNNGTCVSQSTPTPTQIASISPSPTSSSTPIPSGICVTGNMKCVGQQVQECNNGVWENNNTGCSIHSTTPVALCINCITPSSSPKPTPTSTPTPSPTSTPIPGNTYLTLVVGMDGVGNAGTHQNPIPAGTQNPAHTQRKVYLTVRDSNNNEVPVGNEMFIYDSQDGLFIGTVSVGTNPGIKNYTIKVKSDGHLAKLIPGIQVITAGIFNPPIPRIDLTAGDINGDNIIDIKDYNILLSCMSDPDITSLDGGKLCNTDLTFKTVSDLDDNGTVDKFDSNLFLGEYSVQSGN